MVLVSGDGDGDAGGAATVVLRSFRFKLYPTPHQVVVFERVLGVQREL